MDVFDIDKCACLLNVDCANCAARYPGFAGNRANDIIAFFLQTLVVLPTLFASGFWAWGFRGSRDS